MIELWTIYGVWYYRRVIGDGYFTENVITESAFSSRGDAIIDGTISCTKSQLHSYEIKVIQEQQKEIKDLKQRLEVLENLVL